MITSFNPNVSAMPSKIYLSVGKLEESVIIVFLSGFNFTTAEQS